MNARITLDDFIFCDTAGKKHNVFNCLIDQETIEKAIITPQGTTYSKDQLETWLFENSKTLGTEPGAGTDPITRNLITMDMCYPNLHFNAIVPYLRFLLSQEKQNIEAIIYLISDPLTGEIFKNPVVAKNGLTYEKETLLKYRNEQSPLGNLAKQPLYQNRFMRDFIQTNLIQTAIKSNQKPINFRKLQCCFPLIKYLGTRIDEPEYLNLRSKLFSLFNNSNCISKTQKIAATIRLIYNLHDKGDPKALMSETQSNPNLSALTQGRLQKASRYGLATLWQQIDLNKNKQALYYNKKPTAGRPA